MPQSKTRRDMQCFNELIHNKIDWDCHWETLTRSHRKRARVTECMCMYVWLGDVRFVDILTEREREREREGARESERERERERERDREREGESKREQERERKFGDKVKN